MKIARMLFVVALVVLTGQVVNAQGGHAGHNHSAASPERSKRDQLRIAVQEICPMTGKRLGSMGAPIKVKIGQETVFLCCQGCLQKKVDPEHWATIHANAYKAQGICPVMEKQLPKNPKWTFAGGQIIYICCPGCDKKIAADPETYLQKIDELYTAALRSGRLSR